MPSTTSVDADAADDALARLERADERCRRARERLDEADEDALRQLAERREDFRALLERYEDRAKGDGNFEAFIEFQEEIAAFTEDLDDDLPGRETFEAADDTLQRRRLRDKEFEKVRDLLDGLDERLAPIHEWEDARAAYREARSAVERERLAARERVEDCSRLVGLGEADLDAPVERLREPIERYDEAVEAAFESMTADWSARAVLDLVATTDAYPLVDFRQPPEDLHAYVRTAEAGTEPIPQLLEWARFSTSKLDHYVEDAGALKRNVATQETYLRRLNAGPLRIDWPPPAASTLRYRCDEYIRVVDRFASDVVPQLRDVRDLAFREDYERLRASARARAELTDAERERLASEDVAGQLEAARDARDRLEAALEEYPSI